MSAQPREGGFTLVEMLVALANILVILAAVLATVTGAASTHSTVSAKARIEEDARVAMQMMVTELRQARADSVVLTTHNGSSCIEFVSSTGSDGSAITWSSPIQLRYETSTVDANRNLVPDEGAIVRVQDGIERVLCHFVKPGGLTIDQSDRKLRLRLQLLAVDTTEHTVATGSSATVVMRN